jgi:DNA-binding protein HU-beta
MAITTKEFASLLAKRMNTSEKVATEWIDSYTQTLVEVFKTGEGVTINGLGGFYLSFKHGGTVFKFNPSQRLRKLFGWSSTFNGDV